MSSNNKNTKQSLNSLFKELYSDKLSDLIPSGINIFKMKKLEVGSIVRKRYTTKDNIFNNPDINPHDVGVITEIINKQFYIVKYFKGEKNVENWNSVDLTERKE